MYFMTLNKYIHNFYNILVKHEILCSKVGVDYQIFYLEFVGTYSHIWKKLVRESNIGLGTIPNEYPLRRRNVCQIF